MFESMFYGDSIVKADFSKLTFLSKNLSGIPEEGQAVWVHSVERVLSDTTYIHGYAFSKS